MSRVTRWWTFGLLVLLSMGCVAWVKWVDPYPSPGGLAVLSTLLGLISAGWVYLLLRRKSSAWPGYCALAVVLTLVWWSPLHWLVQGYPTGNGDLYVQKETDEGFVAYYWKPTDMTFRMPAAAWRSFDDMPGVLAFCYKGDTLPTLIFRNDPLGRYGDSSWNEYFEFWYRELGPLFQDQSNLELRDLEINRAPGKQLIGKASNTVLQYYYFQLGANGYGSFSGGWDKSGPDERVKELAEGMDCFISTVRSR